MERKMWYRRLVHTSKVLGHPTHPALRERIHWHEYFTSRISFPQNLPCKKKIKIPPESCNSTTSVHNLAIIFCFLTKFFHQIKTTRKLDFFSFTSNYFSLQITFLQLNAAYEINAYSRLPLNITSQRHPGTDSPNPVQWQGLGSSLNLVWSEAALGLCYGPD